MKPSKSSNISFEKALKSAATKTRLSEEARRRGRQHLLANMDKHPVQQQGFFSITKFTHAIPMPIAAAFLIGAAVLGGGGATAYFAQDALPGEALYQVKINVNERVESALAFGTEARGETSARHAERRLAEAVELASRNQLREQAALSIEANFQRHLDTVEEVIGQLEESGNSEAASRLQAHLEARLSAHEELLQRFQENEDEAVDSETIIRFHTHIEEKTREFHNIREEIEGSLESNEDASARKRIAQSTYESATKGITEAENYLTRSRDVIDERSYESAWGDIQEARQLIAEGTRLMEAESYGEAYTNFLEANRLIARAIVTINVSLRLNLYGDQGREPEDEPASEQEQNSSGTNRVRLNELLQR